MLTCKYSKLLVGVFLKVKDFVFTFELKNFFSINHTIWVGKIDDGCRKKMVSTLQTYTHISCI